MVGEGKHCLNGFFAIESDDLIHFLVIATFKYSLDDSRFLLLPIDLFKVCIPKQDLSDDGKVRSEGRLLCN